MGKAMDYGKIMTMMMVLIGAILFLVSFFVPLTMGANLIDIYGLLGTWFSYISYPGAAPVAIGALITAILHPITVALAFLSILKPGLTRIAGILGIVSCAFAIIAVSGLKSLIGAGDYGAAIWVGMAGAIILLLSKFIGEKIGASIQAAAPSPPSYPPPPPPP